MKILLGLCIPAVWLWGIAMAVIVREYFSDVLFADFSTFIAGVTLLFPVLSFAITVILIKTIQVINNNETESFHQRSNKRRMTFKRQVK
tara:strand:+ start:2004 stop:2270 length:267 start_codon:yes stop_codon:yes gene_type:complete